MKHMVEVGIRALKQNASAVVAQAAGGEIVTITDRGRRVAQLSAIPGSSLQRLTDAGQARPARRNFQELTPPSEGPSLSEELKAMRAAERY